MGRHCSTISQHEKHNSIAHQSHRNNQLCIIHYNPTNSQDKMIYLQMTFEKFPYIPARDA